MKANRSRKPLSWRCRKLTGGNLMMLLQETETRDEWTSSDGRPVPADTGDNSPALGQLSGHPRTVWTPSCPVSLSVPCLWTCPACPQRTSVQVGESTMKTVVGAAGACGSVRSVWSREGGGGSPTKACVSHHPGPAHSGAGTSVSRWSDLIRLADAGWHDSSPPLTCLALARGLLPASGASPPA